MSTPTTPQSTYFGDVNVYGNTTMSGTLAVLGTPALFFSNLGVVTDGTSLIGTSVTPFQYAWTTAANTTSANVTSIFGPVGVATSVAGATVTVLGNVVVSNSVSTTNVNVTTSINTGSVMNVNFVTGPGGVGVGTNVLGGAALAVLGTMNAVTSFQAANLILSGTLNVGSANIFSIATTSIRVVTGGATLTVQGFATVSNAVTTTNVYATVSANVARLNTGSLVNSTGFFGFGTAAASNTNAYVLGDLGSSNAIVAPVMTSDGLIATRRINVATVVARSNVGVGGAPVQSGPSLSVTGNVFLSNAFTTPQVFADFMNVSSLSNIVTSLATSNVLIGRAANLNSGFNLSVGGNVVISNALQTTGVTANLINVGASANLLALVNAFAIGTTTLFPEAFMSVNGNLFVSNTLTIVTANTTRSNVTQNANAVTITARTSVGISTAADATGSTRLLVQGNAFVSNALTASNVFATTSANILTLNTGSIFTTATGFLGISTTAPSGTALYVPGNVYASNALTTTTIAVTNSNILASNAMTVYVSSNIGIGTAAPVSTTWTPTAGLTTVLPVGATSAYVAAYSLRALNGTTALTANVVSPVAEFPPYAMTSATTSLAGYSFGGAGSYAATASSEFTAGQAAYFAFDKVAGSGSTNYWSSSSGTYDGTTGLLLSASSLGGYAGEWLKIQFPSQIYQTYYSIQARTDIGQQSPNTWVVLGSTDNSTWNLLTTHTSVAWTAGQTQTFSVNSTAPYNWYALVINSIALPVGEVVTSIGEWRVYGTTFQDFYSTPAGLLTTAAGSGTDINTWGGANTTPGNVLTWYDQSGLSRHVTQTTASLQPIITKTTYGPGYMIQFNGTAQYLQNTTFSYNFNTGGYNYTISTQVSNNTGGCVAYKGVAGLSWAGAGAKKWWLGENSSNEGVSGNFPNIVGNSEGYVLANTPIPSGGAPAVVTWSSASFSSVTVYENGASVPVTATRTVADPDPGTVFAIGAGGNSPYYNGNMFEFLVFSTNLEAYPPAATTIYQNEFSYLRSDGILSVLGNAFVSNALTASNVYATTSANVLTLNTGSIFTTGTEFLGVGTSAPSGTALYVSGNVYTSTALVTTNVTATRMNVTGRANTTNFTMATGQFLGVGTTPTGNALEVSGNAFISGAASATNVFSTLANVGTLNTLSIFTRNSFLGVGTSAASGTSLFVQGNVYASTSTNTPAMFTPAANVSLRGNAATFTTGTAGVGGAIGATLSVTGNLFASNAITATNVVATTANVTGVSNVTTLAQIPAIGLGVSAGGAKLNVRGNVVASNSVTMTNVFATSVNTATANTLSISAPVAVGAAPSGPTLYVQGNLYASNALTIGGNVTATSMNLTSTLNTGSFTTIIIVAGALGWSNTNIFISNSITTTNVFTTNVNAASYVGTSGSIGINTSTGGYSLWIEGNLASSNTLLSLPDVSALTSIYYVDDITKRSPHLRPTPSNAATIQAWISATCNAAGEPSPSWWSASRLPVSANALSLSAALVDNWAQPLLLPDGRVLIVPEDYSNVGFFNPCTNQFSTVPVPSMPPDTRKWRGGVLTPNGSVVFIPRGQSNVGVFNPISYNYSNISAGLTSSGTFWFQGGVLAPDGNVICVPRDSPNICVVNPILFTSSNVGPIAASGLSLFGGGVLLPNGNVVFTPLSSANIGMFNPTNRTYSNVGPVKTTGTGLTFEASCLAPDGNVIMVPYNSGNVIVYNPSYVSSPLPAGAFSNIIVSAAGGSKFYGAVLVPSGNIICIPYSSGNIGSIDPVALTYSNATAYKGSICWRGVLIPDGRIVSPRNDANIIHTIGGFGPASTEFCLSPYFNNF